MVCPVIYRESTINFTVFAISLSSPILFKGIFETIFAISSSLHDFPGGSKIAPGATALTLIFGANSLASPFVIDLSPPLAAE